MRHGKVVQSLPAKEAMFTILVTQTARTRGIRICFKLKPVLNCLVKSHQQKNGVYCLKKHLDVFKWVFNNYNRYISKECFAFLLNHAPELVELALGVTVLPSKRVSTKKFFDHFYKKYKDHFHEVFALEEPEEWEVNSNYFLVKASLNGSVFEDVSFFIVSKKEYASWKAKFGKDAPFVITNVAKSQAL